MRPHPRLQPATSWACSSVVEHCVDIAGVASSILATPTIIRCDCNTQTGLAAIDGRACLLCGPEAPTFGRCRNAEKSARSEKRRVGKECVHKDRSRGWT